MVDLGQTGQQTWEGEMFRLLVENVKDYAIFVVDAQGRVQTWSQGAERLLGYREDEIIGQSADRFFTPEDLANDVPRQEMRRALETGRGEDERWHVRKDGSRFWSSGVMTPLRDQGGTVRGFAKIMRDRTDLKRAEDARNDALEYAESIVETVREPLLVLDGDLRVRTANRSFYSTFHVVREETEGRLLYDLGNRQWGILRLRTLLEEVLPQNTVFNDFEVAHDFPAIGRKVMLLNARRLYREHNRTELILLAIEDITERRKLEDALDAQRQWLRVTLSSIGDAVITTDTGGGVTFLNPVAQSLTGWTQEDAAGKPLDTVFKIVNEETRHTVENPATRALREGLVVGLANHTLLIAKDGTERPIDDSAAPIRNARGEVAGVVLVFRDVTERRLHERQIQDALNYADNIIATLREPFLVLDGSLRVQTANRSFYQNFHVRPEETQGRFIYDLGNRQWDIPKLRRLLGEVISDHQPVENYEVEHDFPDIGRRFMLLNALRIRNPGIQSNLILLAIEDITERKRAETAVQTSEVRYRRLFETAKDGILILDAKTGKIIEANPFMSGMLSYTHGEFLGKELWEIGLFKDKSQNEAAFRELQQHGYVRFDHLPLETNRGEQVEVEFVSNVYLVDHRHVAQCNIRDISERTRLERKTHEQAQALADLHRRKDEFLAMLAHELRNPLAPIRTGLDRIRLKVPPDSPLHPIMDMLERQLGQLTRLVDDLLDVARITRGQITLRKERMDLHGVVAQAVETARPLIDAGQHDLSYTPPQEPLVVEADTTRLAQALSNVLSNAAKYTEKGGRIWLTAKQEGGEAVVRVRDTGIGIAPDMLPRLFDLFVQAHSAWSRSQGGLGIGLAVVKRLVEMHGGSVTAHSGGEGQGSEFVFRLPLLKESGSAESVIRGGTEAPGRTASRRRTLLVDDLADVAEDMASLLREAFGHEVRTANDGPTALRVAAEFRPELVLLDIGLPGMSGYEVARRLRELPGLGDVVLVALTGWGQEEDQRKTKEAGFDHHLVKPVGLKELQRLLANLK